MIGEEAGQPFVKMFNGSICLNMTSLQTVLMRTSQIVLNPNDLVQFLKKDPASFTKEDILRFCEEKQIKMVNFRYTAGDGTLKVLNFVISSREYLDEILSHGERVDGSNIFSFIEAGSSDLYVIPKYHSAFMNPFTEVPTLEFMCSYYDNEGKPLASAPEYVLKKADAEFTKQTGAQFMGLGELEYYIVGDVDPLFPGRDQMGYHTAAPFTKFEDIRAEAMCALARTGAQIKYGHSEVGCFTLNGKYYEQQEIEFLPTPVEQAVEQIVLAKWILRTIAHRRGLNISYAPKITVGKAGSGMHFHMLAEKDGKNLLIENGKLSDMARRMIAGILDIGDAITAFGNTIPTSYLRLVPHQEAPTYVCWGDRNRSVVIRVPLGWSGVSEMIHDANPYCGFTNPEIQKQTYEYRVPDGSCEPYLTLAALIVGSLHGLNMPDALAKADRLYASGNIFNEENKAFLQGLKQLPASCYESAEVLEEKRATFEANDIFPARMIDSCIARLKAFDDKNLSERLYGNNEAIAELVAKYFNVA